MVSSQDAAIAVALTELGYDLKTAGQIQEVVPDSPSDGDLEAGDKVLRVNDTKVDEASDVVEVAGAGEAVRAA